MANVLTKIIDAKHQHILALKQRFPEQTLAPKISDRSLYQALNQPQTGFILECKKASPSKGLIRADFDPKTIANVYKDYATAISVLTDEQFFMGNMDYLTIVKNSVTQPVLCKDFFIEPYQVKLAAHQGADAILLMLSVLNDEQYRHLTTVANYYQLDILTEVSNEQELQRALNHQAKIIGINNRNLRDLTTDLATTKKLAAKIPSSAMVISESGIYTHKDVQNLSPLVAGFLVGSSLMAEKDLDLACRKLIFGENKICGLTRLQDINSAANAGCVYGGFIFAAQSPRNVTLQNAKAMTQAHYQQSKQLQFIGVFVNEQPQTIAKYVAELNLFAVQLHGQETQTDIDEIRQLLNQLNPSTQIWKAIAIENNQPPHTSNQVLNHIDRYIYDSKNDDQFGGTGKTFNWHINIPNKHQAMLAGGLAVHNANLAANQGFLGLDFNSGLEFAPGKKDPKLIKQTFDTLRVNNPFSHGNDIDK